MMSEIFKKSVTNSNHLFQFISSLRRELAISLIYFFLDFQFTRIFERKSTSEANNGFLNRSFHVSLRRAVSEKTRGGTRRAVETLWNLNSPLHHESIPPYENLRSSLGMFRIVPILTPIRVPVIIFR